MTKKILKNSGVNHSAYKHRGVMYSRSLSQWDENIKRVNFTSNIVLTKDFCIRPPEELVANAQLASERWLTDVWCPTIEIALIFHLAKEMVVIYLVDEANLDHINYKAYQLLLENEPELLENLEQQVQGILGSSLITENNLRTLAVDRVDQNNHNKRKYNLPELEMSDEIINAAQEIVLDLRRREVVYRVVDSYTKSKREYLKDSLHLEQKPVFEIGKNKDYAFLGPSASGKSVVMKQFITEADRLKQVIVGTDYYRCFTFPRSGQDLNCGDKSRNAFIRTQDIAYMIRKLVQDELCSRTDSRPDIVVDSATIDLQPKQLLEQGNCTSVVVAYSGDAGFAGIAERAEDRAKNPNAKSADKDRFVNTDFLLGSHASFSKQLWTRIPEKAITTIYSTKVEEGMMPIEIGKIDLEENILLVRNLQLMSEFLNKRNINTRADNPIALIYSTEKLCNTLATHPERKAESLLALARDAAKDELPFTIKLLDEGGSEYASIVTSLDSTKLMVLDRCSFLHKVQCQFEDSPTIEGSILRALTRQIFHGSVEQSLNSYIEQGSTFQEQDYKSFIDSFNKLGFYYSEVSHCGGTTDMSVDGLLGEQGHELW